MKQRHGNSGVAMCTSLLLTLVVCYLCGIPLADASPSFTRQTGAACKVCHYKDMRSLNAYGRKFLLNRFHETKKMVEQRRELDEMEGQGIEHPDKQPIEAKNGHPEDKGVVEEGAHVEAAEPLEQGMIEPQQKHAPAGR